MATIDGYIRVFEASDGGTGDPVKTIWQFFVDNQPVTTTNPRLADTATLAVTTASKVRVTYDENNSNTISQIRMEFSYVCTSEPVHDCNIKPVEPPPPGTKYVCETKRYAPCEPQKLADK
jgi:hypothetical protein